MKYRFRPICSSWMLLLVWSSGGALCSAQELQVFFGNLHSHTSYSDGSATPEVAYAHAMDVAGLDFLAITEHNHRAAPSRIADDPELYSGTVSTSLISTAHRFTKEGRFVALYGQEFSSIGSGNHANVLEIGDVIQTSEVPNGRWDKLLNSWLPAHPDSQGLPPLMLLNHPAQSSSPNNKEYGIDDFDDFETWRGLLDSHAQLINIENGPSHGGSSPGTPSESEFLRYLNLGFHLAPTADQDNHRENWGSAADTRTGVIAGALTKAQILSALRARHVYATEDANLSVIGRVNGHLMGSRLSGADLPQPGSQVLIELKVTDADEPQALYTFDVFKDTIGGPDEADVVLQATAAGNGLHSLDVVTYDGGSQYMFVKVTQTDDDGVIVDRAWLAPVWFEGAASGPAEPLMGPLLTLEVNVMTEVATITNIGTLDVDLNGWTLVSTRGDQRFTFPGSLVLAPGQSLGVTSGANALNSPPASLLWTRSNVWNNSGDPGQLLDPDGRVRAASD